jgi:hypothetical protein
MKQPRLLNWLVPLAAALALVAAAAGLFWPAPGAEYAFTTLRGQIVQIAGQGLYQHDTLFFAAGFRGMDVVTLAVGLPLLALAFARYRRGSLRGGLLLAGALTYFVYIGASLTFSAAFNGLFLVYVALFSASLMALIYSLTAFDAGRLARQVSSSVPHRGLSVFLAVAGLGTLLLWMSELAGPLAAGQPPAQLGPYTTMFTHGFDLAVITPACLLAAVYVWRRQPVGWLLAAPLLILCTLNGVVVIASTISQTLAGISFPIGVYIGMVGSWVVLGAWAVWLGVAFFRGLAEPARERPRARHAAQA